MSFIGIDLGTSFIKVAVLNTESRRLEHIRRTPFPIGLEAWTRFSANSIRMKSRSRRGL